jgi:hypothetical protein
MAAHDKLSVPGDSAAADRDAEVIFPPVTIAAIKMVEEWTEREAINGWFYMTGAMPEAVTELNEHIMRMRELRAPYIGDGVTTE